jgi:hypothetical protein
MCTVLLPPGVNPIAVNKHIISYHITSYHTISRASYRRPINTLPHKYGITDWMSRRVSVDGSKNKKAAASIENRPTTHLSTIPQNGQRGKCNLNSEDIMRGYRYSYVQFSGNTIATGPLRLSRARFSVPAQQTATYRARLRRSVTELDWVTGFCYSIRTKLR